MSGFYKERTLQQVPMPINYHLAAKSCAKNEGITLNEFYDNMIECFIKVRHTDPPTPYMVSPKNNSKYVSLWINSITLEKAKEIAVNDGVSVNRFVYSALVYSLQEKDRI